GQYAVVGFVTAQIDSVDCDAYVITGHAVPDCSTTISACPVPGLVRWRTGGSHREPRQYRCAASARSRPWLPRASRTTARTGCRRSPGRATPALLKEECVWQHIFPSFVEARRAVRRWIGWYNERRPHQALGYL